ncbi:TPA: YadA-like family protein [Neisseria meningitidis]
MSHFQSKVLTAAILATFCSGALAATNDDDVKKAATVAIAAAYNNGQEINGFKAGETIYDIGEDGTITKKDATAADVEADDFKGLGLKKVVTNLTKTVNENKQNVDAKVKAAETAAGKAEAAAGTANTAADKAEAVAAKVTDIKADIATNKDNIAKKANSADVYTREESDSKFVRIDGLNATTEKLDTRLASAEKSIADHDTRLNGLDKTVSDLRKETRQGLAEQAALSGLFQPYNVGRFNVTAAVGGYKSESAVAIGTGFRFTENFAAKAGVAVGTSSGSSAAYHVGVNYEW